MAPMLIVWFPYQTIKDEEKPDFCNICFNYDKLGKKMFNF